VPISRPALLGLQHAERGSALSFGSSRKRIHDAIAAWPPPARGWPYFAVLEGLVLAEEDEFSLSHNQPDDVVDIDKLLTAFRLTKGEISDKPTKKVP
jgi:hypothetical protein